jgi:hypothetical protein
MRRQAVVDHSSMIGVGSSTRKSAPHLALLSVKCVTDGEGKTDRWLNTLFIGLTEPIQT